MTQNREDQQGEPAATDGRALRRERNIDAVRVAVLGLSEEGVPVTMETIADRAGIGVRSIYRYFGDLEGAIRYAFELRLAEFMDRWALQRVPPPDLVFDERLEELLDQRFCLERLGRPMRGTRQFPNPDLRFDAHVLETFEPELSQFDDGTRERNGNVVAWTLRPRAIRSHIDSSEDADETRRTIRTAVLVALGRS